MAKARARVSSPATTKRPRTRRDEAMPHYDEPAHVPASFMASLKELRRCIVARDGKFSVSNSNKWVEVDRKRTVVTTEDDSAKGVFVTEDGRRWSVTIKEVR